MAPKSLRITRKRKREAPRAPIGENSLRSDFRVFRVQTFISLPHQKMVESSQCWLKWEDEKEVSGIKVIPATAENQFHLSSPSKVNKL
jgi:hypothetical protein